MGSGNELEAGCLREQGVEERAVGLKDDPEFKALVQK
jgi:hypothetical protein